MLLLKREFFVILFLTACIQDPTQAMSVIDNVAFIDFVKAFGSELSNDMHVCSTEPYNYSLIEIDFQSRLPKCLCQKTI